MEAGWSLNKQFVEIVWYFLVKVHHATLKGTRVEHTVYLVALGNSERCIGGINNGWWSKEANYVRAIVQFWFQKDSKGTLLTASLPRHRNLQFRDGCFPLPFTHENKQGRWAIAMLRSQHFLLQTKWYRAPKTATGPKEPQQPKITQRVTRNQTRDRPADQPH